MSDFFFYPVIILQFTKSNNIFIVYDNFPHILFLTLIEHCVNGDSVVPHLNKTCKDEIKEDPNRCEVESNKDRCCASCAGKRKRSGGEMEYYYKIIYKKKYVKINTGEKRKFYIDP